MKQWLYRLQYKYSRYGIENLMMYIVIVMLAVYLAQMMQIVPMAYAYIYFDRGLILSGQIWRVLTFIFMPIAADSTFFMLIALYMFYYLGNALEREWGTFRFNIYFLFGVLGAIIAGFITRIGTNQYIYMSILLAFAQLFPNMELRLFFLIPVKVKYIGYVTLIIYGMSLLGALINLDYMTMAAIIASLANFFIFFGPDIHSRFLTWKKYYGRRRDFRQNNKDHWR